MAIYASIILLIKISFKTLLNILYNFKIYIIFWGGGGGGGDL